MTHDILQTDIELARRLLEAGRPDQEIIATLTRRSIARDQAVRLLADLRQGRRVSPALPEATPPKSKPTFEAEEAAAGDLSTSDELPVSRRLSSRQATHGHGRTPKRASVGLILIVALLCAGTVGGVVTYHYRYHRETRVLLAQLEALALELDRATPAAPESVPSGASLDDAGPALRYRELLKQLFDRKCNPAEKARLEALAAKLDALPLAGKTRPGARRHELKPLALELRPGGLHLGDSLLTRTNAFDTLVRLVGAPSRTNCVDDQMVYAYDALGLLVNSRRGAGDESIALDFDALGGTNGTTSPFGGTLAVEGQSIQADSDTNALSALGLGVTNVTGSVLAGSYRNAGISFAYFNLKSSPRLSMVVIDLR